METAELDYNNYWDYVSVQEQREGYETLKDLAKESFPLFKTYLDELYYIEANFIYMNLVLDIPQQTIADLFSLSQLGVSKRVRGGVKKIQTILKRPEYNRGQIQKDLDTLLPKHLVETAVLYYHLKTFSLVSDITGASNSGTKNRVAKVMSILEFYTNNTNQNIKDYYFKTMGKPLDVDVEDLIDLSERYYNYFKILIDSYNYGDYIFKGGNPFGEESSK